MSPRNQSLTIPGYGAPRGTGKTLHKEFFIYSETFTLAAGAVATGQIPIQADSDFVAEKLTYFAHIAGAAQTDGTRVVPGMTVLITDTGSNRQLSDAQIFVPAFFGTGEIPFILPQPRVFKANSVIQLSVTSTEAVNTNTVQLSFIGHKVYRAG